MKVAIDITPIIDTRVLGHRVRGTGYYLENLKKHLLKEFGEEQFTFFSRKEKISEVDLVHYPYFEPFFITLPLRLDKKMIVTVHDLTPLVFPQNFPSGVKGKIKWNIQKRNLLKSKAIITDSMSSKKDIIKYAQVSPERIHVVYLAASEKYGQRAPDSKISEIRKKYSLPEKFALYVGDATWNKNLVRMIEAALTTDIPLVMVGKALIEESYDKQNPWNQELSKAQQLAQGNPQVLRLGFISDDELKILYNTATLLVMPSIYEGFGLPILEAMQSGCPVVTSKSGSIPEVAGEAVFYVDPNDTDSIASGIEKVYGSEKTRKDLTEKGIKQAKNFSWGKTARETFEIYKKVFNNE